MPESGNCKNAECYVRQPGVADNLLPIVSPCDTCSVKSVVNWLRVGEGKRTGIQICLSDVNIRQSWRFKQRLIPEVK